MNITILTVTESFSAYKHHLCYVLPERLKKIQELKSESDKTLSLLSHLLARHKVSEMLNIPFEEVRFKSGKYGKPYVENMPLHFSLSHSGNVIVFVSHSSPVGIDIQKITTATSFPALRFFTQEEQTYVKENPQEFFPLWTKKEAYVKMLGTGLSTSFKSFNVLNEPLKSMFYSFSLPRYAVSICAENISNTNINIEHVK